MTPLERAIARQRAALRHIEQNGASEIVDAYRSVEKRLKANLRLLGAEIERARSQGIEVRPGWLFAQERYRSLLSELQAETLAFIRRSIIAITNGQREAVSRAPVDAERLIVAALGPAPPEAGAALRASFGRLPARALERLVGYAGDGHPLGLLLGEIVPEQVAAVKNSLAYGVATGQNPRVIADDVTIRAGIARNRALLIARTEVLRSYRAASSQRYRETRVVRGWEWVARLDARTCPACVAMNGTVHGLDEELHSHPNCRCAQIPLTPSWREMGFDLPDGRPLRKTPEQAFDALPEAEQLGILGRRRLEAYNAGEISLADLVRTTRSRRWGPGRRAATLGELALR